MPATKRGIYHNLAESKYRVSNGEILFFFSSESYLNKFMNGYEEYRKKRRQQHNTDLNMDSLSDIEYYLLVEKRGFFVRLKRAKITKDDLFRYALRKMAEPDTPTWERT